MLKALVRILSGVALVGIGYVAGRSTLPEARLEAAQGARVFELRTYTTHEGKLDALHARFRNHTKRLFERHGMTNVGYWVPQDAPGSGNTLIYVIAHKSRDAAKQNWDGFRNDPEWQKAKAESEAAGPIVNKVDSVFMNAVDYSPIK
ncbi:MAG TPA: NIPSNAP family protein [Vicinamibacterales bacterium]|nr:NIPSNAP family protein [Vicinamibacterales bacterium]